MVQRVVGGEEAHPRPERNGEAAAEYGRAPRRRAVPELSPNHGDLSSVEWYQSRARSGILLWRSSEERDDGGVGQALIALIYIVPRGGRRRR